MFALFTLHYTGGSHPQFTPLDRILPLCSSQITKAVHCKASYVL